MGNFIEIQTRGRIYGGTNAEDGEFPFQVSIWFTYVINFEHMCGASILSPTKVLSAAHCYTEVPGVPGNGIFLIKAGLTSLDRRDYEQARSVESFLLHPEYPGGTAPHDIMLVRKKTLMNYK